MASIQSADITIGSPPVEYGSGASTSGRRRHRCRRERALTGRVGAVPAVWLGLVVVDHVLSKGGQDLELRPAGPRAAHHHADRADDPDPTIIAAPATTVAAATSPCSNRGTITSFVTQRTAHDDATVARAKTAAPPPRSRRCRGQPDLGPDHPQPAPPHDAGASRESGGRGHHTFLPAECADNLGITCAGMPS